MATFDIATLLNEFEQIGVFDFMLPFLLIFAVVFGIMQASGIFGGNKGVSLIVALVIGAMAIRLGYVQAFFTEVFPRFGIALATLLVVVILAAIFIPDQHKKGWAIGFAIGGGVFGLVAVINSFSALDWFGSTWVNDNLPLLIGSLILIVLIIMIAVSPIKGSNDQATFGPWWGPAGVPVGVGKPR